MPRHKLPYHDATADDTVAPIKTAAGKLHSIEASQVDSVDNFIQLFDAAAAGDVNLGTTTPVFVILIPAGDGSLRGGVIRDFGVDGLDFQLGIHVAVTTTVAGSTAPTTPAPLSASFS